MRRPACHVAAPTPPSYTLPAVPRQPPHKYHSPYTRRSTTRHLPNTQKSPNYQADHCHNTRKPPYPPHFDTRASNASTYLLRSLLRRRQPTSRQELPDSSRLIIERPRAPLLHLNSSTRQNASACSLHAFTSELPTLPHHRSTILSPNPQIPTKRPPVIMLHIWGGYARFLKPRRSRTEEPKIESTVHDATMHST